VEAGAYGGEEKGGGKETSLRNVASGYSDELFPWKNLTEELKK
jgi:hypothetical protein